MNIMYSIRINSKVKSKYWVRTQKFGISITKDPEEPLRVDKYNLNYLWWEDIFKEMKKFRAVFELFDGESSDIPHGYKKKISTLSLI